MQWPRPGSPTGSRRPWWPPRTPRYFRHHGLDGGAMLRGGGATIEVQLATWLYTDAPDKAVVAVKFDLRYSKTRILLMYLNTVYFGHGYYGATAAAHGYFGQPADLLSWPQAALLAALLQAPDGYDPRQHLNAARARRDYVLGRLTATGCLTDVQRRAAVATDLQLSPTAVRVLR